MKHMKEKNMIYVNGDSFTAGIGLADHEFVPDFEKYNKNNISTKDYFNKVRFNVIQDPKICSMYNVRNKELSWPARLSKILGIEIINAAEGGSSMGSILYRTMLDLTKLQMEGITPKKVIIMLTETTRLTTITNTIHAKNKSFLDGDHRAWIESTVLGHDHYSTKLAPIIRESILIFTDQDLLIKWLLEVALLNNVVKSFTGSFPIIAAPEFLTISIWNQMRKLNIIDNLAFSELVIGSNILNIDPKCIMRAINYLPDRHFDNETHEVFAQQIAQTLNNKETYL